MPRIKLSDELKKEIAALPNKEKDKLIFRMLPSNQKLVDQLIYKLVEEQQTLELRRDDIREKIDEYMNIYPERFYSSLYLRGVLREISGIINYHRAITGDKLGEIEFNLQMLNLALDKNKNRLQGESKWSADKFNEYVVKRAIKLDKLISALHEDYQLEFEEEVDLLRAHMREISHLAEEAERLEYALAE